ncbi:metallophosphoesterase [Vitreoscilla massiliensis]|uniref:Metallophosphoesterase n=1 Tax=Vitreoscilla massiliensis TaxID=1689272 RepID=A0ABY4E047_9NEIS|nr:metallophosphoesterase [Vitreoscilla massiliensis]UOO89156.1 metallophosphoesterase [Vitreoscilla massiliensis]
MSKTLHLPQNQSGKDYIIGDLHGCYEQFQRMLIEIGFDKCKDRMIACGDLIDRGKDSLKCARLLTEPWFYSVMGNHENMFIQCQLRLFDIGLYIQNGGEWATRLDEQSGLILYDLLKDLPYAIEIETASGNIGVVHADINSYYWDCFKRNLEQSSASQILAIWGRSRISHKDTFNIEGIDKIFFGHTVNSEVVQLGNTYFIDTGVVFGQLLTCYCVQDDTYHQISYLKGAT